MYQLSRVAAVVAAAALTVTMPAAQAARDSSADSTGDVWSITYDQTSEGESAPVPSSESVNVDLTRTVVTHGSKAIRVVASYDDLKKTGDGYNFHVKIRDDKGRRTALIVGAGPGWWRGFAVLVRGHRELSCDGLRQSIDVAADTVTVLVPRGCMLKPRWIKYQAWTVSWIQDGSSETWFTDDARSDQARPKGWSTRIRRG